MGPLSYMRSVVDRNVVMRRIPVLASPLPRTDPYSRRIMQCCVMKRDQLYTDRRVSKTNDERL
jgi:hypothetical protein